MTVLGVVLAAGRGARFAAHPAATSHKLLAPLDGRPLIGHAVEAALGAGLDELVVVQGAIDLRSHLPPEVTVLENRAWATGGLASSLQVAVGHARAGGHVAIVVGLGDQPRVGVAAWRAVARAPDDPPIAVATYAGQRGNPVRLAAAVWPLLPTDGDEGARGIMVGQPGLVREVPCTGEAWDVDTVEDLEQWS